MVVLAVASLLDNLTGETGTSEAVYHSAPFAVMWGVLAVSALIYICRHKPRHVPALDVCSAHASLALSVLPAACVGHHDFVHPVGLHHDQWIQGNAAVAQEG